MKNKCIFWLKGKCNSDYARGLECEGGGSPEKTPENCPYKTYAGNPLDVR